MLFFCPEVFAVMAIPHAPAEIKGGDGFDVLTGKAKVIDIDGQKLNEGFITAAKNALAKCQSEGVYFTILGESSPSYVSSQIYDGSFNDI
jgi:uncharacterized protein YbbK (DUF523 family)